MISEKKLCNFWQEVPKLRRNSWKWTKYIPKKSLLDVDSRLFSVFWGWLDGEKLGNTISNVAQDLVMTGGLILFLLQPGITFRSLKRKLSR